MLSLGVVNRRGQNVRDGDLLSEGARMFFLVTTGGCKNCCILCVVMTVKVLHRKQFTYSGCAHVAMWMIIS